VRLFDVELLFSRREEIRARRNGLLEWKLASLDDARHIVKAKLRVENIPELNDSFFVVNPKTTDLAIS
jgi:hypothetical protein